MNTRGLRAHHHTTFYKIQVSKGLTDSSCHFDPFYHSICMLTTRLFDFVGVELPALIWWHLLRYFFLVKKSPNNLSKYSNLHTVSSRYWFALWFFSLKLSLVTKHMPHYMHVHVLVDPFLQKNAHESPGGKHILTLESWSGKINTDILLN
jgi:hypothetical protein